MWTDTELSLLNAVLDEIVPASSDGIIPGAGAIGVADFLPDATTYAPDPVGSTRTVLAAVVEGTQDFVVLDRADKVATLKSVEANHPDAFATFVRLTYMGYYSRPDIRPHFGIGAHPIHPEGYSVPSESKEYMDELTAPVHARGQAYRDVSETFEAAKT